MKLVELVMGFIVLLVFRLGSSGDMIIWGSGPEIMRYPNPPGLPGSYPERSENDLILGLLVSPGYFFITLVLLGGLAFGDESEYGMCLFNLLGFLLHLSAGAVEIVAARDAEANGAVGLAASFALGSMCILTGLIFMIDATWSVMDILYKSKK